MENIFLKKRSYDLPLTRALSLRRNNTGDPARRTPTSKYIISRTSAAGYTAFTVVTTRFPGKTTWYKKNSYVTCVSAVCDGFFLTLAAVMKCKNVVKKKKTVEINKNKKE